MYQNAILDTLEAAQTILTTYSNGTLPAPKYVSMIPGDITFIVRDEWEVKRWAQSVDAEVQSYDYQERDHYWVTYFKHGAYSVSVQFSKPINQVDRTSNANLAS